MPGEHDLETFSGRYVNLVNPDPATITLDDVAHGLSVTRRFGAAASRFYSVAEHAVLVADKLEAEGYAPFTVLAGLHHDDAEAFLGDIPRPLKLLIEAVFGPLETRMALATAWALGTPGGLISGVKDADDWALAVEAYYLMPSRCRRWVTEGLYQEGVDYGVTRRRLGLAPDEAKALWLARHRQLLAQLTYATPLEELLDPLERCEGMGL